MPYIITTLIYPADKVNAVVERYFEVLEKYRPDKNISSIVVQDAVRSTHQGVETINIADVRPGKLEAALKRTSEIMAMFMSIPGLTYQIDTFMKIEEALANIGHSLPE